jgi:hypothetical protein
VIACCLAASLLACKDDAGNFAAELPDLSAPPPAPAEVSHFSVPLEYDFSPALRLVEGVVPRTFGSIDSVKMMGGDERRHYAYEAVRSPFSAFAQGNLLHLRATIAYKARGYYKPIIGPTLSAGCGQGKEQPRIIVELATPLSLTSRWHLASKVAVVRVEPASNDERDHCDVSILHRDVTEQVVEAARAGLAGQLDAIDRKITSVDLAGPVSEWWAVLGRPIKLADGVWLVLGPEALRMGRVRGQSRILTVPMNLDARPRIVTSATEPDVAARPSPNLGRLDEGADGFRIVMDADVDFEVASGALTLALGGKRVSVRGHPVRLDAVRVSAGSKGRIQLAVSFTGDASGTLHLIGTPKLDTAGAVILVPDLDFDLETNSGLLRTYSWLKSVTLRSELRSRARVPITPAIAQGKSLLLAGLNRKIGDAVTLSATVDSVAVQGLFVTRGGLTVRAAARGRAGVAIRQR